MMSNKSRHTYSEEEIGFLRENYPKYSMKELTPLFNETFNLQLKEKTLTAYCVSHKISSGRTGRFEEGHISPQKGKKLSAEHYEKCKHTFFQKGHIPKNKFEKGHNAYPIGYERVHHNYIEIKIGEPSKWVSKHKYLYEQAYGQIPKGTKVIFADGNNRNFNLDNLIVVSQKEIFSLNRQGLIVKGLPEATKVGVTIIKLIERSKERAKK